MIRYALKCKGADKVNRQRDLPADMSCYSDWLKSHQGVRNWWQCFDVVHVYYNAAACYMTPVEEGEVCEYYAL